MIVVPSAKHAASARTGSSSITLGITSPAILTPRRLPDSTTRSASGSPASSLTFSTRTPAPISSSTLSTPVREGLKPTPFTRTRALGWQTPATSQKAAPLMSAGTLTSIAVNSEARTPTLRPSAQVVAPIAVIMRSVWSREAAGCRSTVSPSA